MLDGDPLEGAGTLKLLIDELFDRHGLELGRLDARKIEKVTDYFFGQPYLCAKNAQVFLNLDGGFGEVGADPSP